MIGRAGAASLQRSVAYRSHRHGSPALQDPAPGLQSGETRSLGRWKATRSTWFSAGPLGSAFGTLVGSLGWSGSLADRTPSADLLCQLDDDSLGAADVAEPVAVLVAHQLADELGAAGL